MHKSITSRYFTTTAIILLCSVIILGAVFMMFAVQYFRNENAQKLENIVFVVSELLEDIENGTVPEEVPKTLETISSEEWASQLTWQAGQLANAKIFITNLKGETIVCSEGRSCEHFKKNVSMRFIKDVEHNRTANELGLLQGIYSSSYYTSARSFYGKDGNIKGYVFASSDASNLAGYFADAFSAFFVAGGIMMLVSSILSIVLTSRMTTPLRKISEAATSFGKGDFTARVPVEGDDELAGLAITFNNMATSLEEIDQNRQSFMGNIAHELRTPMTSIKGFVDGMIDGVIPPEKYPHYLQIVSQESGRLTRLIKNMLDLSKLQAGEYIINAENYDIWDTITSALFGAEKRLEENHIGILGFAPNKTLVFADRDIVYQVFYNILDNAIKFTNDGGTITIEVLERDDGVLVSVKNTGQGISEEALPYIFDRFYKEDKSRGLHAGGSGLGMHISKILINRSGGEMWTESVSGEYAKFFFKLPKGETEQPTQAKRRKSNITTKD